MAAAGFWGYWFSLDFVLCLVSGLASYVGDRVEAWLEVRILLQTAIRHGLDQPSPELASAAGKALCLETLGFDILLHKTLGARKQQLQRRCAGFGRSAGE